MNLNKTNRESIRDAALAKAFDARDEALLKQQHALARAIYDQEWGHVTAAAAKLPRDWVRRDDEFDIKCAGFDRYNRGTRIFMGEERPLPSCTWVSVDVGPHHVCYEMAQDYLNATKALETDREALSAKITGVLASVRTVAKLLEVWPEAKEFIPGPKEVAPMAIVPASLIEDINKMMRGGA